MQSANAETESDIQVLYEDDDVVVINKPAGMLVHDDGSGTEHTVVDWLLALAPEARAVGEPGHAQDGSELTRSGVVHRLDKDTSGVLILAKTNEAFQHLKAQFKDRHAKKEYRAFVYGAMREKWGTVDRPIGRSAKDFRKRSAERGSRGMRRNAVTDWELIGQNDEYAYLKVLPKTGRTHQIRVHLKAIGRPVVGDALYAPKNLLEQDNLGFSRLALHAYMLSIGLPNGETKRFIAPLPPEFEAAETALAT
jgi:23S rRNA pseudouridine1911/1915/1917 synthase